MGRYIFYETLYSGEIEFSNLVLVTAETSEKALEIILSNYPLDDYPREGDKIDFTSDGSLLDFSVKSKVSESEYKILSKHLYEYVYYKYENALALEDMERNHP